MFGALKPGFRSLATLKLAVNVVGELQTKNNSCGIARFPCDSTAFFYFVVSLINQNRNSELDADVVYRPTRTDEVILRRTVSVQKIAKIAAIA